MPLFTIAEDTYMKAFLYAAVVVAITSSVTSEYRSVDPFDTFRKQWDEKHIISWSNIGQTALVSMSTTFIVLWLLYFIFGFGTSFVSTAALATATPGYK